MAIRPLVHKIRILAGARDLFWAYSGGQETYFGPIQGGQRSILGLFRGAGGLFWAYSDGAEAYFGPIQGGGRDLFCS